MDSEVVGHEVGVLLARPEGTSNEPRPAMLIRFASDDFPWVQGKTTRSLSFVFSTIKVLLISHIGSSQNDTVHSSMQRHRCLFAA